MYAYTQIAARMLQCRERNSLPISEVADFIPCRPGERKLKSFGGRVRGFYHNSFSASMRFSTWARNACRSVSPTCTIDHFETRRPGGMTMQISTLFVALRVIA